MDKRILIVVDPQVDFVSGSLPVPGAAAAMDALALYIEEHGGEYAHIVVSGDRHPVGHCSFVENGGEWPRHCVADSVGAAIWPAVMEALYGHAGRVTMVHKGEAAEVEEYSVLKNDGAAKRIAAIIRDGGITEADVCGLAGDVCVENTYKDAVRMHPEVRFRVLDEYSPRISG